MSIGFVGDRVLIIVYSIIYPLNFFFGDHMSLPGLTFDALGFLLSHSLWWPHNLYGASI